MSLFIKNCIVSDCDPSDDVLDYIDRYNLQDAQVEPVFKSRAPCMISLCAPDDSISRYIGSYNFQSFIPISNSPITALPVGNGFYVSVPPGTFMITVPPTGGSFTLFSGSVACPDQTRLTPGCDNNYSYSIPPGSSPAAVQQILDAATAEVATIKAQCCLGLPDTVTNPPAKPQTFGNAAQTQSCGGTFTGLNVIGQLPSYISVGKTSLTIQAGVFVSTTSQADADADANFALSQAFDGGSVVCGWCNTPQTQTCPDGKTVSVPACSVFSTVSQADADSQASAMLPILCEGCAISMNWSHDETSSGPPVTITPQYSGGIANLQVTCPIPPSGNSLFTGDAEGIWTNTFGHDVTALVVIKIQGFQAGITVVNFKANTLSFLTTGWSDGMGEFNNAQNVTIHNGQTLDLLCSAMSCHGFGFPTNLGGFFNLFINVYMPTNC